MLSRHCRCPKWLLSRLMVLFLFSVGICKMVLEAFKQSLCELEGKTRLELKILHQDPSFWEVVLRSKLIQMSQKFSTQATSRTSFQEAEIRSAYIGTYCCSHASLVQAAVKSGCFPPLAEFIQTANESKRYVSHSLVLVHFICMRVSSTVLQLIVLLITPDHFMYVALVLVQGVKSLVYTKFFLKRRTGI